MSAIFSEKNIPIIGSKQKLMGTDVFFQKDKTQLPIVIYIHGFNGFKDWDMTHNYISIWPIERILEEYQENEDKNFIGFADFCIKSHFFGYLKTQNGVFIDNDLPIKEICNSFLEYLKLIVEDSEKLY